MSSDRSLETPGEVGLLAGFTGRAHVTLELSNP